jgi:hypothetical protein
MPHRDWKTPFAVRGFSAWQSVVCGVGSDPEPDNAVRHPDAQSTIMEADSNGPKLPGPLEVKRRVVRIRF